MADNQLEEVRVIDNETIKESDPSTSVCTQTSNKDESDSENCSENADQNIVESNDQEKPETRQCWVCLATDEEDEETGSEWIHPCRCSGSAKYCHHNCLQLWIDEKQKYNSSLSVSCTQCNTEYVLIYTQNNGTMTVMCVIEFCDRILYSGELSHSTNRSQVT